jgi:hemerythrin-like metal-binding protein
MKHKVSSFSIGIPELDDDHERMFRMLAETYDLIESHQFMIAHHTLGELSDYLSYHCAMEEAIMKRYQIPSGPEHKSEHIRLRALVMDTVTTILRNKDMQATSLPKFALDKLQQAIEEHIKTYSTKIASFIEMKEREHDSMF